MENQILSKLTIMNALYMTDWKSFAYMPRQKYFTPSSLYVSVTNYVKLVSPLSVKLSVLTVSIGYVSKVAIDFAMNEMPRICKKPGGFPPRTTFFLKDSQRAKLIIGFITRKRFGMIPFRNAFHPPSSLISLICPKNDFFTFATHIRVWIIQIGWVRRVFTVPAISVIIIMSWFVNVLRHRMNARFSSLYKKKQMPNESTLPNRVVSIPL